MRLRKIPDASPLSDRQLQAAMIAQRIKQFVGPDSMKRIEDKQTKNPDPSNIADIVILMRSLASKRRLYPGPASAGIPVSCGRCCGYFEATESLICLFMKVLDNRDAISSLCDVAKPVFPIQ